MGKGNKCSDLNLNDSGSIFFWGLIVLLFLLVIGNFILTMMIISFFKIGMGMESIKLIPELKAINFYGIADFQKIYKKDGVVESFRDSPMTIEAYDSFLKFDLLDRKNQPINRFMMGMNGTEFKSINQISIIDPVTNLPIFSTTKQDYKLEKPAKNLEANVVHAAELVSPIDRKLEIQSVNMRVSGIEGTTLDAKEIFVSAEQKITLNSSNGSIKLSSLNGIYIDIDRISRQNSTSDNDLQFKLCVCYPKGTMYRVNLKDTHGVTDVCRHFNRHHFNPCV